MSGRWTDIELDIVKSLARGVQMLTALQIGRIWLEQDSSAESVQLMRPLVAARLVQQAIVVAHPALHPKRPILTREPGKPDPNYSRISERILGRWNQPSVVTLVYWASPRTANISGCSVAHLRNVTHRDHNLLLSDVYAYYRVVRPCLAVSCIGENSLPKAGYRIKDPDAFLMDEDGSVLRVVESAGCYSARQVESFHDYCAECSLPYELW